MIKKKLNFFITGYKRTENGKEKCGKKNHGIGKLKEIIISIMY